MTDENADIPENMTATQNDDGILVEWDEPILFDCEADIPYNDECTLYVIEIDPYCCDFSWDSICEGEYQDCMEGRDNLDITLNNDSDSNGRRLQVFDSAIYDLVASREITGYNIFRDDSFIDFTEDTWYLDTNISSGTIYCYDLTAVYEDYQSLHSEDVCIETEGDPVDPGDLNIDGSLDVLDIVILVNMILGNEEPDYNIGDMDQDGVLTVLDVILLINTILDN